MVYQKSKREKLIHEIDLYIKNTIKNSEKAMRQCKSKYKKLKILLSVIQKYDHIGYPEWNDYKKNLMAKIVLPLARKNAHSKNWVKRLLAVKTFLQCVESSDESIICKLLSDDVPIVHLEAISILKNFPSKKIINTILTRLGKERKKSYFFYLTPLVKDEKIIKNIIEERLKREPSPFIKAACYEILLHYDYPTNHYENIDRSHVWQDAHSKQLELSLAAIRLIAHVENTHCVIFLMQLLSNEPWQKRVIAIQALKKINDCRSLIPLKNCLSDPERWVRLNAAAALKLMGEKGISLLENINKDDQPLAFEAAMYVLGRI